MNQYIVKMIAFARAQIGKEYMLGRHGPLRWDCVGLVLGCARAAGLDATILPLVWTVRALTTWGENHGLVRLAADGATAKRGDVFLWGDASRPDHRPVAGAGHTGLVLRPVSARFPRGKAISAYNPERDIIVHDLIPSGHLALYGFITLPYPVPEPVEPPVTEQPEPPPPSDAADEQPDDELTVAELQAKIAAAQAALE